MKPLLIIIITCLTCYGMIHEYVYYKLEKDRISLEYIKFSKTFLETHPQKPTLEIQPKLENL